MGADMTSALLSQAITVISALILLIAAICTWFAVRLFDRLGHIEAALYGKLAEFDRRLLTIELSCGIRDCGNGAKKLDTEPD